MLQRKKRLGVIFTGGTISMRVDDAFGGIVPDLKGGAIVETLPEMAQFADIEPLMFGRYPGPHVHPQVMLELAKTVQDFTNRDDIDGVVVTHGTDTLEETAYFLDCLLTTPKPVVVIGSMRNSSEPGWDGPRNLRDGIIIASDSRTQGLGVLVNLSDHILAASEATKVDTVDLQTFESLDFGPLGRIINKVVRIHRSPVHRDVFTLQHPLPEFIPLIKCYTTSESLLLEAIRPLQPAGIIVEAMGVGNVPPPVFASIKQYLEQGTPVVIVSRCPIGRVEHVYAYEGAGKHLYQAGAIFADYLNGQKARIKLMLALAAGLQGEQLRKAFEWDEDE